MKSRTIVTLAVVLIGDNPASQIYVRNKTKAALIVLLFLSSGIEFIVRGPLRALEYGRTRSDLEEVYFPSSRLRKNSI